MLRHGWIASGSVLGSLRWQAWPPAAPALARLLSSSARAAAAAAADAGAAAGAPGGEADAARERMEYDLCIVGAGPAGLSAAIRFKQVGQDAPAIHGRPGACLDGAAGPALGGRAPAPPLAAAGGLARPHPASCPALGCALSHPTRPTTPRRQLCADQGKDFSVCVIEKRSEVRSQHTDHKPHPLPAPSPSHPQLCADQGKDFSVCVIEKGSEVGSHIISGNVLQPTALDELFPGWREKRGPGGEAEGMPLRVEAKRDRFYVLTPSGAVRLPAPRQMKNKGNYVISLRWVLVSS